MTCIVGMVHGGRVWMGADSLSGDTSQWHVTTERHPKVFLLSDRLLIGFTSSWRMGQLLRWQLALPEPAANQDAHQWLSTTFVDAVRACLKAGGFAKKENEVESGGDFLVGYQGRLFAMYSDYQIGEPADEFDAVGCGRPYALGAMHAAADEKDPERRITRSLEAAAYYSAYVRGPFQVLSL